MCFQCSAVKAEQERAAEEEAIELEYAVDRAMTHLTSDCFSDDQLDQLRAAFLEIISEPA